MSAMFWQAYYKTQWWWVTRVEPVLYFDVGRWMDQQYCGWRTGHAPMLAFRPGELRLRCGVCGWTSHGVKWGVKVTQRRVVRFRLTAVR